ncbi:MAG: porin, partial [Rickettsiales bacterium]
MKKFLLNSTAIVGLIASSVFADSAVPTSSLGGIVDFQAAFRDQEKEYEVNLSTNQKDVVFNNTARIYGKVEGKADAGFTYGAVVGLKANIETNRRDSSKIEKTYLYIESDMGRFEAGSNYSAAKTLKVDASTFARATGGISGDWYKYYNFANNANPIEASLKSAYNYFEENHYNHENFTDQLNKWSDNEIKKITYYSPRMSGFQVGVSYAPDAMNGKMPSTVLDPKNPTDSSIVIKDSYALLNQLSNNLGVKNLFSGGVNYTQQMDQMLVSISAT